MHIEPDLKLDFKDVLIRPKRSTLASRADVNVARTFAFLHSRSEWQGFPLIASNMDTTGTLRMCRVFHSFQALVAIHKYYAVAELVSFFGTQPAAENAFYTMGLSDTDLAKFNEVKKAAAISKICLDVANGYTEQFLGFVTQVRTENPSAIIMAGSVVTGEMTEALLLAGADIVRVGIGSGSVCTTRKVTGVGYPQLSAIIECADAAHGLNGRICSDGGCVVPGDVAKAYGAGADFVMIGGMLAGHEECDGEVNFEEHEGKQIPKTMTFYGMSSETAMNKHAGGVANYRAAEGKTVHVPFKGPVSDTVQEIIGGVRSTMTYIGATELREVSKRTTFVRVSAQLNTVFGE